VKKITVMWLSIPILTLLMIVITVITFLPTLHTYAQQQNTNTTTPPRTAAEVLAETINSIALLVGVVAPLIVSGLAYVKSKSQDPDINKALEDAKNVGLIATAIAHKAVENKQNIKAIIETGLEAAPEDVQKAIEQRKALIDKLNKEIQATNAQISRLVPLIPGEANADTIPDLPREKDF
jgi:Na+/phosphate symporter